MNSLQKLGIELGNIGLGVEHFVKKSGDKSLARDDNTRLILKTALELGITHFDLVFNVPYFFDVFSEVIEDRRKDITIASHLGNIFVEKNNKVKYTRSVKKIRDAFEDQLERLNTDYTDIAMIQYLRNEEDYDNIHKGLLDYVYELKKTGKARAVGISGHDYPLLLKFIKANEVDVVLTIVNFATGQSQELLDLIQYCRDHKIALTGIKTLLKGKVMSKKTESYGMYYTGGRKLKMKLDNPATPNQCFRYALDLGCDTVVFGVKNSEELVANMKSLETDKTSFNNLIDDFN